MLLNTFLMLACSALAIALPVEPVSGLPPDSSVFLTEASSSLSAPVSKRGYGITSNGLSGPCKPVTIIFARGTLEAGNIGILAGPPFFNALALKIGADKLAVQGVPYPASIPGYLQGGDVAGSDKLAQLTAQAAAQCPDTQIVLSGYSQGAQLVHNGGAKLAPEVSARVKAVVLFGDPFENRPIPNIDQSIVKTFCFETDLICKNTIIVDPVHLSYSIDAIPAAQFVAGKVAI